MEMLFLMKAKNAIMVTKQVAIAVSLSEVTHVMETLAVVLFV